MTFLSKVTLFGLAAISCAGCALPVAILANPDEDKLIQYVKPQETKLTKVTILWEDATNIPIDFAYSVSKYQQSNPPPPDKNLIERMKTDVRLLTETLRGSLPKRLKTSLESNGVTEGKDYKIILKPKYASKFDNHIGLTVSISVRIIDQSNREIWTTITRASRGYNVIGIDLSSKNDVYIENTLQMLLAHMKKAELIQ